ncbi:hypothetical protein D9M69_486300 [compost metagenome]
MPRRARSSDTGMRPSSSHMPSARWWAQASACMPGCSSPVMASSRSRGVMRPCTTPYSSTTNTSRPARVRNCSSSSMPVSVSGTNTAGVASWPSTPLWPEPRRSRCATLITPTTSSSELRHTGYHECTRLSAAASATFCSACATVLDASSHSMSARGIMSDDRRRSSRWNTLRTIWCSCSSIMPASTPSPRLALISSSVTCWTALVSTRNSF